MRPEAKKVKKERIERRIEEIAGYDVSTLRKRINVNAYDALMVLQDIKDMASMEFFNEHFAISPYDFKRKPRN